LKVEILVYHKVENYKHFYLFLQQDFSTFRSTSPFYCKLFWNSGNTSTSYYSRNSGTAKQARDAGQLREGRDALHGTLLRALNLKEKWRRSCRN
jgi:hypothetical protein